MLFEMLGLGILLPLLSIMLNPNIGEKYPVLKPILRFLGNPSQEKLVLIGLFTLVVFYLIKTLFLGYLSWRQSKFSSDLSEELSKNLFKGYLLQPYSFHLQRNSAELIRNIQSEINQFQLVTSAVMLLCIELSQIFGLVTILIMTEPLGAIIVASFMYFASLLFNWVTKKRLVRWGTQRQFHAEKINIHLFQGLGGIKDLKLLGREQYFLQQYDTHNAANARISAKVGTSYLLPRLYFELLAIIGLAGMIIVMVLQNRDLALMVPTLAIFVAAAFRMIPSVNRIMSSVQQVQFAKPVVDVLYNEFSSLSAIKDCANEKSKLSFKTGLVLQNISFRYSGVDTDALHEISLDIKPGESIGLIGSSGSGKSTLVDVILGLLVPYNGTIKIDGKNIADTIKQWQNNVGYVPQSIYLTDDTLKRNIAFGIRDVDIDDMAVERAIQAAQLKSFVKDLPEGLDTCVGERGVKLSGGQRQRIGIARALYHNPSVLVLDEATSALDTATENEVMSAITALKGEITILIVAHRLTTVYNCDRLVALQKGRIIETGTPQEILLKEERVQIQG